MGILHSDTQPSLPTMASCCVSQMSMEVCGGGLLSAYAKRTKL